MTVFKHISTATLLNNKNVFFFYDYTYFNRQSNKRTLWFVFIIIRICFFRIWVVKARTANSDHRRAFYYVFLLSKQMRNKELPVGNIDDHPASESRPVPLHAVGTYMGCGSKLWMIIISRTIVSTTP